MDDRTCPSLRSAREKLCVAQTDLPHATHRTMLQEALDIIDRIGVLNCPDWSKHDLPTIAGE